MEFPFLERARWVTDKFILLMLGVFPLFVGFQGYHTITESKFWFFAIATGLWAAAVIVLLVCGRVTGERYKVDVRPAHIAIALFMAIGGVSACVSEYGAVTLLGADRMDGYLTTVLYCLIFLGVSMLGRPRRRYAWAAAAAAVVCCFIAVLQLLGLDPFGFYPDGTNYYDKYVAYNSAFLGTIGNTNLLASYLCLPAGLLPVYGALSPYRRDRLLLLPGAFVVVMLGLIDVDAGVVAAAGTVIVAVPVVIQRDRAARIAGGVSGGVTAAGLAALYFWPGKSGTLYEMSQVLHGHLADEFGSHRGQIWKQGWQLFLEKPWLGGGPGTTSLRFDITWTNEQRGRTVSVLNPHNAYLGYLMNVGLFGALAFFAAVACSLVTWFRRRKHGALYPALGTAFVCYLIQDFFCLNLSLTAPMLWVVWGLLESREEAPRTELPETAEPEEMPLPEG